MSRALFAAILGLTVATCAAHSSLRAQREGPPMDFGDEGPNMDIGDEVDVKLPGAPPDPEGEAPTPEDDGAYADKAAACAACKFHATGSCAMYKTCLCHATNAFFGIVGVPDPSDKDNWHWACAGEGGSKYELCFTVVGTYMDTFGDKIDPNNKKCPE